MFQDEIPPEVKEKLMFLNECDTAVENILSHYPEVSLDEKLIPLLDAFMQLDDEKRASAVERTNQLYRSRIENSKSFKLVPLPMWQEITNFMKGVARNNPRRLRDVVYSIFEIAEAPPGHPCRQSPVGIGIGAGSKRGKVTVVPSPPGQQLIFDFYQDIVKLPSVRRSRWNPDYNCSLAIPLVMIAEFMLKQDSSSSSSSSSSASSSTTSSKLITSGGEAFGSGSDICPCGKKGSKMCGRCKVKRYCSLDCQRVDWPKHKLVCGRERHIAELERSAGGDKHDNDDSDYDDDDDDVIPSHGHSHGGVPCHGHGPASRPAPSHGHSHGGQPCHGHGHSHGGRNKNDELLKLQEMMMRKLMGLGDSDDDDDYDDDDGDEYDDESDDDDGISHGHSHGGVPCHGHSHSAAAAPPTSAASSHGHSHSASAASKKKKAKKGKKSKGKRR